jgi:sulfopyruvate decarboxylase subunit alpha
VLENDSRYLYVVSVREDNAVGLAVGAYLGGKQPAVLMQSSGLGQCIDALASLASLYKIPLLLVIGWRGADVSDAPEHRLMGLALPELLRAIGISFWTPNRDQVGTDLRAASLWSISEGMPSALLIRGGVIQ